ncbi:MAG: Maf family protein, partial [Bacteriovoracaceae bacterium]
MVWSWLPFKVVVSDVEETSQETDPLKYVMDLAEQKALDVYGKVKGELDFPVVMGCDTIVVFQDRALEKPKTTVEARSMLETLSGSAHEVLTAVSIVSPAGSRSFYDRTFVRFEDLSSDLLELYLKTGESMDKA